MKIRFFWYIFHKEISKLAFLFFGFYNNWIESDIKTLLMEMSENDDVKGDLIK